MHSVRPPIRSLSTFGFVDGIKWTIKPNRSIRFFFFFYRIYGRVIEESVHEPWRMAEINTEFCHHVSKVKVRCMT